MSVKHKGATCNCLWPFLSKGLTQWDRINGNCYVMLILTSRVLVAGTQFGLVAKLGLKSSSAPCMLEWTSIVLF
jgi:hypothetical protein